MTTIAKAVLTALALLSAAAPAAQAGDDLGAGSYRASCAVCHGQSGKGDGEFATSLKTHPADLTTLTERNHGEFPFLKVFQIVDGRSVVASHGSRIMPIWGDYFARELGDAGGAFGKELLIRARIVSLVDYVESLQK